MKGESYGADDHGRYLAQQKAFTDPQEYADSKAPFEALNALLRRAGLPRHDEPEDLPDEAVFEADMIGYGGLHSVRRLAAHWSIHGALPEPDEPASAAAHDPFVEQVYVKLKRNGYRSKRQGIFARFAPQCNLFAHLMLHSDAEGFYVPQGFDEVLLEATHDTNSGLGGMVGSSLRLLEECETLAQLIDLPADMDPEDERLWEVAELPASEGPLWQRYGREAFGLARVISACRHSRDHGACVVFC